MATVSGVLRKMKTGHDGASGQVSYQLNLDGEGVLELNPLVGQELEICFAGEIFCIHCDRKIKKTFNGGYCYNCFQRLAQCDMCIVKPHLCHHAKGTCRDNDFAETYCFIDHTVYLARSSSVKIGITRSNQQIHRWMDQGAVEALVIGRFPDRRAAGLAEHAIADVMSDRTNWRNMLKNVVSEDPFDSYFEDARNVLTEEQQSHLIPEQEHYRFVYPVQEYPEKVVSKSLDKHPVYTAQLMGIKGQYLIFDTHVINLRSHAGYHVTVYQSLKAASAEFKRAFEVFRLHNQHRTLE